VLEARLAFDEKIKGELRRIEKGGAPKYHQKNAETGKLFVRERVRLLLDEGSFLEDGVLANALDPELPPTASRGSEDAASSR
jgi:acetyl-CoA carboxylase carboxyltransferase component